MLLRLSFVLWATLKQCARRPTFTLAAIACAVALYVGLEEARGPEARESKYATPQLRSRPSPGTWQSR